MIPFMHSNSIYLPTRPIVIITGILLLSSPDMLLLILFLFFLVILALGTHFFLFYPISGFDRMGPYPHALGLPANCTNFSLITFQVTLFVLEVPLTWQQSVFLMKEYRQWAIGLLRLGILMYIKTLLFCLLMLCLCLCLILSFNMFESLLSFRLPYF